MASFVLFIFTIFLLSVARSATPAKCNICENDSGVSCNGVTKDCGGSTTCLSVSSETKLSIGKRLKPSTSRTCVEPSNNLAGSFYFDFGDNYTLDFASMICNETEPQCQAKMLVLPIRIYENGKSCPKCFRTGYDNCESDGEVPCVGDLVSCSDMNGEITSSSSNITTTIPFAGKGCVSQSACTMGKRSFRFGTYTFNFTDIQCSPANGALSSLRRLAFTLEKKDLGPQVAFFFPCILGIFAVKMLS